ncbi:hypothetical protein KR222_003899, partial [Zaprionus bogoriensis]
MCFFSIVTRILVVLFGILFPARNTFKALDDEKLVAWGKYWIVYACLFCLELVGDTFLAWLPLYAESKLLIVLWLVVSAPQASVWIFDMLLTPLLSRHMSRIDYFLQHGKRHMVGDCFAYVSGLWMRCVNCMVPVASYLWRKTPIAKRVRHELQNDDGHDIDNDIDNDNVIDEIDP